MKVTTVKENHRVEQHGPTGINQQWKTQTSPPTMRNDVCPFKINIRFNKKDDLFYLSKNGSLHTHSGHVRRTIIFAKADQLDKNVEKTIKDFEVCDCEHVMLDRGQHVSRRGQHQTNITLHVRTARNRQTIR
jgi:hypothetical protein